MSLYGPSPGMLKAVRWFSRGLYLFMAIGTAAAISWGIQVDSENETLRDKLDNLREDRQLEKDDNAEKIRWLEEQLKNLETEESADDSQSYATRREPVVPEMAVGLNQGSVLDMVAIKGMIDDLRDELSQKMDGRDRRLEIRLGELAAAVKSAMRRKPGNPGAPDILPDNNAVLTEAWNKLVADRSITSRVAVADQLRQFDGPAQVSWLRQHSSDLPLTTILSLIGHLEPAGGDKLAADLVRGRNDLPAVAASLLQALAPYNSIEAADLYHDIATGSSVELVLKVRATSEMVRIGDSRSGGIIRTLFQITEAGDDLRLALIRLPLINPSPEYCGAAEVALLDPLATAAEVDAACEVMRGVGTPVLSRLQKILDKAEVTKLSAGQKARLAQLCEEIRASDRSE